MFISSNLFSQSSGNFFLKKTPTLNNPELREPLGNPCTTKCCIQGGAWSNQSIVSVKGLASNFSKALGFNSMFFV